MQGLTIQIIHHTDTPKVIGAGRRKSVSADSVAFAGLNPFGKFVFAGLLSLLFLGHAFGIASHDIILAWSANAETNIGTYQVRYGTSPGVYTKTILTGWRTRTLVTGLEAGRTYYFTVCAYSVGGLQGDLASEVVYTTPPPANSLLNRAPDSWISSPATGGTIYAGQSVSFSGGGYDPDRNALTYRWNFGNRSGIPDSTSASSGDVRFDVPGTYQVTFAATDSLGLSDPEPAVLTIKVLDPTTTIIPRTDWKLKYVNSEEANGYAATRSFDGDPSTFWHTKFTTARLPKPPHEIQINLGTVRNVNGFEYLPRQDDVVVGNIGGYQFYTSIDGKKWGKPAAIGTFSDSSLEKRVNFPSRRAKFIRLVSVNPADGYTDCNVAEINLLQGPPPNSPPVSSATSVSTTKNKAVAIKLKGADANLNPLTFQIVKAPSSGSLSGTPPNLIYRPKKNFTGKATFTYRVSDGTANSKVATVTIQVKKAPGSSAAPQDTLVARSAPIAPADLLPSAAKTARPVTSTTIIGGEKFLVLTVAKPVIPDGISRSVQVSPNLLEWFSGKDHTTVLADNEEFLRVRDNVPIAPGKKRYIRLKTRPH